MPSPSPPPSPSPSGVGALLAAYATRSLSPAAVVRAASARAHASLASSDSSWISVTPTEQIEAALASLPLTGALRGVPFAVKDNIDVAGVASTAACKALAAPPAAAHAAAVARLVAAGAVCVGKTNLDQFATGLVGTRSPFGVPACVFGGEARIPGGSSSGSAVVVARGDVAFALGTDTAGSGRVPAAFNNIVGVKPTFGRVSTDGVLPACRTLDCVSVFALSASDGARVLAVMEGGGEGECVAGRAAFPHPLRVGVPHELVEGMSDEYRAAFGRARQDVSALGTVVDVDFGVLHRVAALLYDGPWVAERYAVLEELLRDNPAAVEPVVRSVVEKAVGITAVDAFRGRYRLADLAAEADNIWATVDVLMVPTAPLHPTRAAVDAEPVAVNSTLGSYTNFVNLLGWAALATPASLNVGSHRSQPGSAPPPAMPFGVTWIAPGGSDMALLALGARWQRQVAAALPFGAPSAKLAGVMTAMPTDEAALPASEAVMKIAVVGAHLTGMPLHYQLEERDARLVEATRTAEAYMLYALKGTTPKKPGLVRVSTGGFKIEVEVYSMPTANVGSFLALIPSPLGLGTVELEDGSTVNSFICEPYVIGEATDVSACGGWRAYIDSLNA